MKPRVERDNDYLRKKKQERNKALNLRRKRNEKETNRKPKLK